MAIITQSGHPKQPLTAREMGIMQGFPPPPEKRPTLENWDLAPFNRWSFQNIRSLFPTSDVRRAGQIIELPKNTGDLGGLVYTGADGEKRTVDQGLTHTYVDGFLVCHRGEVIEERYFNDMQPHTPHLSQSVAKSIVGTLAGVLHHEGLLDLEMPLVDIVPELAACGYARASLNQVLDMQSGVRFTEDYGVPHSDMTRIDIASGWRPQRPGEEVSTIRDVILTLSQERPHGKSFSYRSIESDVIAWAIERSLGAPLAQLLSDRIWSKLGAERDAFFTVDRAGTALADGGFNATLRDYGRFGLMMAQGGRLGKTQVVPEAWVQSCRVGEPDKFGAPYTDRAPNGAYRRQWWIHDARRGDLMARGVFGQLIYIDYETDLLVVVLSTWPDYLIFNFAIEVQNAVMAIRRELAGS
ncbi:MAG: 6-aminohexanoate hydrolase [Rhodobacteraceae bacterium CG17_big_fil_post_rev_8_21_14_2_50_63_15]|nr:MAG: 6-aminohexanoate hydrolase [Rhodobacteraceae bacterium CG17_big_fil_post_rev_8_21_14_2_50_63_15]